jgi:predicted nucleic acid-binding protein
MDMREILLDTNVYVAFKRGDAGIVELIRKADLIGVSTVILGELLAGFRCGSRERENRKELEEFLAAPRIEILDIDEKTAEFYAAVFSNLRAKGRPIPSNDLWLAATAMQHGLALATLDQHFSEVDGLLLATP